MSDNHVIVGVHISNRVERAADVQKVFTAHGSHIKTRVGLNDVSSGLAGPGGLILLEIVGGESVADGMIRTLTAIPGVDAKKIVFEHH